MNMHVTPTLSRLHAEHKARARRLGLIPARKAVQAIPKPDPAPTLPQIVYRTYVADRVAAMRMLEETHAAMEARAAAYKLEKWRQSWRHMVRLAMIIDEPRQTIAKIILEVTVKYGVSVIDIKSQRKARELAISRYEIYWRAKRETLLSMPLIGKAIGGRDHTTILHGIRRYEELRLMKAGLMQPRSVFDAAIDLSRIIPMEAGE